MIEENNWVLAMNYLVSFQIMITNLLESLKPFLILNNFYYFFSTNAQVFAALLTVLFTLTVFIFSLIEKELRFTVSSSIIKSSIFLKCFCSFILTIVFSLTALLLIKSENGTLITPHIILVLLFLSIIILNITALSFFVRFFFKSIKMMSSEGQVKELLILMDKKYFNSIFEKAHKHSSYSLPKSNGGSMAIDSKGFIEINFRDPLRLLEILILRKTKSGDALEASIYLDLVIKQIESTLPKIEHANNRAVEFCDMISKLSSPIIASENYEASIRTIQLIKRFYAWGHQNKFDLLISNIGNIIREDILSIVPYYKSSSLIRDFVDELGNMARLHLRASKFINSIFATYWLGSIANAINNKKYVYADIALENYFHSLDWLIKFGEEPKITIKEDVQKNYLSNTFFKYCFMESKRSQIISSRGGTYPAWAWTLLAFRHFCETLVCKQIESPFQALYDDIIRENIADIPHNLKDTLVLTSEFKCLNKTK